MRPCLQLQTPARYRGNQLLGVGRFRSGKNFLGQTLLDGLAMLEHQYLVGNAGDHCKVVRDQHVGDARFGLQLDQQVENLRLY